MKFIRFLGAAGTVTGSLYFLKEATGKGIVVDFGMFQGSKELEKSNWDSIPLHPEEISGVFVTHAHLDHSGRLPLLRKFGYTGPVYTTEATKSLLEITLLDAVKVSKEHNHGLGLYTEDDVTWLMQHVVTVKYGQSVPSGTFGVTFHDAGHILGSAFLEVYCKNHTDGIARIVFSGDLGNFPEEIVKPTEMLQQADVVVMESTYGDHEHSHESAHDVLSTEIEAVEKSGGTLLIPAFSIERAQEILHLIDHLKKENRVKEETRVFLDSPMAVHVTRVYQQYRELYNAELTEHAHVDDPFIFPGLSMIDSIEESRRIAETPGTKVIIAGAGMMTGGRIRTHAKHFLPLETTRLLFVGFQCAGSLGRELLDGIKMVMIDGVNVPVRAHIGKSSSLSSHADQPKLLTWLLSMKGIKDICLVHGEEHQRAILKEKIQEQVKNIAIYIPERFTTLSFGKDTDGVVLVGSSGIKKKTGK